MKLIIIFAVCSLAASAEQFSYEGYKVFRVTPKLERDVKILQMLGNYENVDLWSKIRNVNQPVDVMVSPKYQQIFSLILKQTKMENEVLIENVKEKFDAERASQTSAIKPRRGRITFNSYHRYETIQEYLKEVATSQPSIVTLEVIGQTYEGRDLNLIKLCQDSCGNNPIIFIDCGIHAREWISPAMCLYIIQELAENAANAEMLNKTDWYIIPVLNPDGYEFSHTDVRMWRKTRRIGTNCNGVDGNRNFDFHWMGDGASSNECSEVYAGPSAFSESEISAFRDVVENLIPNIKLYLAIHSYGQFLIYPWGWTSELPEDWEELEEVAQKAAAAIQDVAGTIYDSGTSSAAAGCSDDWMKGVAGSNLSYTIELPGGGSQGFDLPPSRIAPVVKETFEGIRAYQAYVAEKFGRN